MHRDNRLPNLRKLCDRETASAVAERMGWSLSYLSQLAGPNPRRKISENTAREIERVFNLTHMTLDK